MIMTIKIKVINKHNAIKGINGYARENSNWRIVGTNSNILNTYKTN